MSRITRAVVFAAGCAAMVGGSFYFVSTLTHPSGVLRAAVPGSLILMLCGTLGLYLQLGRRTNWLRPTGLGFLLAGLILGLIGMVGSAIGVLEPNPVALVINGGEHAGLASIAVGMIIWGSAALRVSALGRWSVLPLLIGLLSLSGIAFLLRPVFSAIEDSFVPLVFSGLWVLLGFALLTSARVLSEPEPTGT